MKPRPETGLRGLTHGDAVRIHVSYVEIRNQAYTIGYIHFVDNFLVCVLFLQCRIYRC